MAELDLDIFDLAHARAVRVVFAVLRLSLALSILVSTFAYAEDGGKVTGTLTDQTGAVVPSAEVDLANKSTGVAQHTKTGPDGAYIFPLVPVGVYTLAVHAAGFKPVERDAMSVNIHSMVQQDLTLEVGNEAGIDNWDLALLKTIPFTEARALELRLETFNTFNHTQFDGANSVNGNFTSSSFGQVVSSASPRILPKSRRSSRFEDQQADFDHYRTVGKATSVRIDANLHNFVMSRCPKDSLRRPKDRMFTGSMNL